MILEGNQMSDTSPTRIVSGKLVPAVGTWEFDPGHTIVGFEGKHLMVSRIRGTFKGFSGRLVVGEVPEQSRSELVIETASVESGFKDRDEHLRSADWFNAVRYPTIRFESGAIEHVSGGHWNATGTLTIREVSRPIAVDIEFDGGTTDPWGNQKIGAVITSTVDRHDFGLTWNMPLKTGGLLVGKEVTLTVHVEAIRQLSKRWGQQGSQQQDSAVVTVAR